MKNKKKASNLLERISTEISAFTGTSAALITAFVVVLVWAVTGPVFHFSLTWQLVINTGTSITTFLMVFVIQRDQNKDTMAIQLKLNELIAATKGASNKVLNIEDLTENELMVLKEFYAKLGEITEKDKKPIAEIHADNEREIDAIKADSVNSKARTL